MNNNEYPGLDRTAARNDSTTAAPERGHDLRYPHNPLEGFGNGCNLDLRVRLALNLLQNSPRYGVIGEGVISPQDAATDALDVAGALLEEAEKRGWIGALDETGELTPALRAQAKRTASFGTLQQIEQSKFAQNEVGRVVPMAPGAVGGGRH